MTVIIALCHVEGHAVAVLATVSAELARDGRVAADKEKIGQIKSWIDLKRD